MTSSRTLTSSSQTVTDTIRYDVWGDVAERTGNTPTPHQFVGALGYEREADSGLYFIGTRYYDPSVGRFISQDVAQWGVNWYGYAANNPVRFYEWQGMAPDEPWPWYLKPIEWIFVKPGQWIQERVESLVDKLTPKLHLGSALISKDPLMKELAPQIVAAGQEADQTVTGFKNYVVAGAVIALATYGSGEVISEILKGKKGNIKNAPLPKGSPSWSEIGGMTWGEIEAGARQNRTGFKTIRKLLTDKRFDK